MQLQIGSATTTCWKYISASLVSCLSKNIVSVTLGPTKMCVIIRKIQLSFRCEQFKLNLEQHSQNIHFFTLPGWTFISFALIPWTGLKTWIIIEIDWLFYLKTVIKLAPFHCLWISYGTFSLITYRFCCSVDNKIAWCWKWADLKNTCLL